MKKNSHILDSEFYFELFNQLPDALVLLDSNLIIKFYNASFKNLFQVGNEVKFEEVLGRSIGCKTFNQSVSGQQMKISCANCKLKNSVKKTISDKSSQKADTIVLQTMQSQDESLKLIQFQTIYIEYKDQEHVLLKLNDLTEFGNKAFDLIANSKNDY